MGRLFLSAVSLAGKKTILPMPIASVAPPLSSHADMQACVLAGGKMVVCPESFSYYKKQLAPYPVHLICGKRPLNRNYPEDISYNVAVTGNFAIHNFNHTDPVLKNLLLKEGYTLVQVSQGYAKCSVCPVAPGALITADEGIYRAVLPYGIDALLISSGHVRLPGFPYGFLGGATGLLQKNLLAVCGTLSRHPDRLKIYEFLNKYAVKILELHDREPEDIGSILAIL